MSLDEKGSDPNGNCGPCQNRHKFTLATAGRPLPAGLLHGMGGVEHHRAAGSRHDRQRPHVRDQSVIAEACPALAQQQAGIPGFVHLGDDVGHIPGGQELAFLHIHRPTGFGRRYQQVGLA